MKTHEQFITLTTAKLLKRAGFDWATNYQYRYDKRKGRYKFERGVSAPDDFNYKGYEEYNYLSAPTQAEVMRWLRECKGILIEIDVDLLALPKRIYSAWLCNLEKGKLRHIDILFPTYEQAAEKAIQKCLKKILNDEEREILQAIKDIKITKTHGEIFGYDKQQEEVTKQWTKKNN